MRRKRRQLRQSRRDMRESSRGGARISAAKAWGGHPGHDLGRRLSIPTVAAPQAKSPRISTLPADVVSRTARIAMRRVGAKLFPWQTNNWFGAQKLPADRSAWILLVCRRERASSRDSVTVKSVKLIRQLKRTSITRSSKN